MHSTKANPQTKYRFKALLCVLLGVAWNTPAQSNDCANVLIQNTYTSSTDQFSKLNSLRVIDQTAYSHFQSGRSGAIGGSYGTFSLNASESYSEFDARRSSFFSSKGYSQTERSAADYLRVELDDQAAEIYALCIRGQNGGLALWFTDVTDTAATLHINWAAPNGVATASANSGIQLLGSTSLLTEYGNNFSSDVDFESSHIITRAPNNGEVRVAWNLSGYSGHAIVRKTPPPPPLPSHSAGFVQVCTYLPSEANYSPSLCRTFNRCSTEQPRDAEGPTILVQPHHITISGKCFAELWHESATAPVSPKITVSSTTINAPISTGGDFHWYALGCDCP